MEKFVLYAAIGLNFIAGSVNYGVDRTDPSDYIVKPYFSLAEKNAAFDDGITIDVKDKPKLKKVKSTKPGPARWTPRNIPSVPLEGDQTMFSMDDFDFFDDYMDPELVKGTIAGEYLADGEIGEDNNYHVYFFDAKTGETLMVYILKEE